MTWRPPRTVRNLDAPVSAFQVLGERSSGTNFVTQLLRRNLGPGVANTRPYGWKHGFIDRRVAATPGLLTVVVYRHPVRWLRSLHARPLELSRRMHGLGFAAFIRHPWIGAFDKPGGEEISTADQEPETGRVYPNPMRLRTAKIAYLEELATMPGQIAFVRFEDANRAPRATLDALAHAFGLPLAPYARVDTFKGKGTGPYIPRQQAPVAPADMAFIGAELDLALEARIGYRLEEVPRFDGLPPWDTRSLRSLAMALRRPPAQRQVG